MKDLKGIKRSENQSLEETHDMIIKALPGQSYAKETFHKVSTTQVTGEALKKLSAGGKGGMSSSGDAREQKKEVQAGTRVMVLSDPSQETFDFNTSNEKLAIGFGRAHGEGVTDSVNINKKDLNGEEMDYVVEFERHTHTTEYLYEGQSMSYKVFDPRKARKKYVMRNGKWKRVWIKEEESYTTLYKSHGRDYHEFSHSGSWDASDLQRLNEYYLSGADLEASRERYDELCGYRGAWMYLGLNGASHRRYRIIVKNDLNDSQGTITWKEWQPVTSWAEEASHRHHNDLYKALNQYYYVHGEDEEYLKDWMLSNRKDHAGYVMWRLSLNKPTPQQTRIYYDNTKTWEKDERGRISAKGDANKFIKSDWVEERPDFLPYIKDVKSMHAMECTRRGKMRFMESPKIKRSADWKCEDTKRKFAKREYYKNLRNETV